MNKKELIEAVAYRSGETKQLSAKMVDCLFSTIEGKLSIGGEVLIVNFGKFSIIERRARTGRNPQTIEPTEIVARKAVRFRAPIQTSHIESRCRSVRAGVVAR